MYERDITACVTKERDAELDKDNISEIAKVKIKNPIPRGRRIQAGSSRCRALLQGIHTPATPAILIPADSANFFFAGSQSPLLLTQEPA